MTALLHELTPAAALRTAFHDPKPTMGKLFVAGRDGLTYPDSEPLVSAGAYWITLARPWRQLFAYFAPKDSGWTPEPGIYEVDGKTLNRISVGDDTGPLQHLREFWNPDRYPVPLERVTVEGYPVDTADAKGPVALYRHPTDGLVGVDGDWLRDLTGHDRPWDLPAPYGHPWSREQTGPVLRQMDGGPLKPVAVFLDRLQVIDAHYEGDPGTPERRFVGTESKAEGLKLAAVIMPRRLPEGRRA